MRQHVRPLSSFILIRIAVLCLALTACFVMSGFAGEQDSGTVITGGTSDGNETTDPNDPSQQQSEPETPGESEKESEPETEQKTITVPQTTPVKTTTKTTTKTSAKAAAKKKITSSSSVKLPSKVLKALNSRAVPDRKLKKYKYLYIGASRVHQMSRVIRDSKTYIVGSYGADFNWFTSKNKRKEPALKTIRSYLAVRPTGNVIIELGNNDPSHVNYYMALYKELIRRYPKAHFWFVDVLPGSGRYAKGKRKNPARVAFNKVLHKTFPNNCLGGYDYLIRHKQFRTVDGTHYPIAVRKIVYSYVMKQLGRKVRITKKGNKYYVK